MIEHPNVRRKGFYRKKVCKFCVEPDIVIDYKKYKILRYFITERGKINQNSTAIKFHLNL